MKKAILLLALLAGMGGAVWAQSAPAALSQKDLEAAATTGSAEAQLGLGLRMLGGPPSTRNPSGAYEWISRSAAQGHPPALRALGYLHANGIGTAKDYALARKYYSQAADAGDLDALNNLGAMALRGEGSAPDVVAAEQYFTRAVQKGHARSMVGLGLTLLGTNEKPGRAPAEGIAWLRRAATEGNDQAAFVLYHVYRTGIQTPRDERQAGRWLMVAAKAGNVDAQLGLAQALRTGDLGMGREPREAYLWISLAAQKMNPAALVLRSEFEKNLTPNEIADVQQQLRDWKPAIAAQKAGRLPVKDLKIPARFDTVEITPDNFARFMRACLPTVPDTAIDKELKDWNHPRKSTTTLLFDAKTAGTVAIYEGTAACVHESEAGFPVLAAETMQQTIEPQGIPESLRDEWFASIARIIATKGYAEVVYQFANGNGFIALYRLMPDTNLRLEYRMAFKKAGEYDVSKYDAVFTHPDMKSISTSRYGNNQEKFVLMHRFRPQRPLGAAGAAPGGMPAALPMPTHQLN